MRKYWINRRIGARLLVLGLLTTLLASTGSLIGYIGFVQTGQNLERLNDMSSDALLASEINADVAKVLLNAREYLRTKSSRDWEETQRFMKEASDGLAVADEEIQAPDRRKVLDEINSKFSIVKNEINALPKLLEERDKIVLGVLDIHGPRMRKIVSSMIEGGKESDNVAILGYAAKLQEELMLARFYTNRYLLSNEAEYAARVRKEIASFDKALDVIRADFSVIASDSRIVGRIGEIDKLAALYKDGFNKVEKIISQRNKIRQSALDEAGTDISSLASRLKSSATASQRELSKSASSSVNEAENTIVVVGLISSLLAALLAWLSGKALSVSISQMIAKMNLIAEGHTAIGDVDTVRRDEIGDMGRAVVFFRDAALEKQRLEEGAKLERIASEEKQAAAIRDERELVLNSIGSGIERLAAKDLTFRLTADLPEHYAKLKTDFNNAIEELAGILSSVQTSSSSILVSSDGIATSANELSSRTEQQAAGLEETTAALADVGQSATQSAGGAKAASEVVGSTKSVAAESSVIVQQAVEAMGRIEESSKHIAQIISVIDEIAFQTNLLALNAGVEAARAGEAGRGFAVVASEVRGLAARSAEAAQEIKKLISDSSEKVTEGVDSVAKAGASLEKIISGVEEINGVVGEISTNAQNQAMVLQQINNNMAEMDRSTQNNAAMASQSLNSSRSLADQSKELANLVGRFKIAEGRNRQPSDAMFAA